MQKVKKTKFCKICKSEMSPFDLNSKCPSCRIKIRKSNSSKIKYKMRPVTTRKSKTYHPPNSSYWSKKADALFLGQFRYTPCKVCATQGKINCHMTTGHHIVAKSISSALRYKNENIVTLCQGHHCFDNEISPHSNCVFANEHFIEWLKKYEPEKYAWTKEHRYDKKTESYKESYERLKKALG